MKKSVIKAALIFVSAVLIQMAAAVCAYAVDSAGEGMYSIANAGNYDQFTNHVDGYTIFIDKGMSVDMSHSAICTVFENENKRIEIYRQDVSGTGRSSYINYSNKFLNNSTDHYLEFDGRQTIGGHDVDVTVWSRNKLSGIANDKNYYACVELGMGHFVYTIFIKANAPVYDLGGYSYIVENFRAVPMTHAGGVSPSAPVDVEGRGWNDETKDFFNTYFSDEAELTWGIFEPDTALFEYGRLDWYENYFEYEFPIILNYSEFQNNYRHPNLQQRLETAYSNGKTLELTLQTAATADGGNMVYKVLNGEYNMFLADYAKVIADFDHPVLFRLGNEMNGDWCPYSSYNTSKDTVIFKEFYKYVYSFFERAGADNVIWIWNPNSVSFPNFKWNDELMYYPGDEYVDIVGMTAYNTGTYYSEIGEKWQEFYQLYDSLYYRYCANYGQPLMITEFASASTGGNKEQWVINMFDDMKMYDKIKVAVWWDGRDWDSEGNVARAYMMDETPGLLEIFKRNFKKETDRFKEMFGQN